jgi:hypothetical protein
MSMEWKPDAPSHEKQPRRAPLVAWGRVTKPRSDSGEDQNSGFKGLGYRRVDLGAAEARLTEPPVA